MQKTGGYRGISELRTKSDDGFGNEWFGNIKLGLSALEHKNKTKLTNLKNFWGENSKRSKEPSFYSAIIWVNDNRHL